MTLLDGDERAVLDTYLEELGPLDRAQRWWLGEWLCERFSIYGQPRTRGECAEFRGVSRQAVEQTELRGFRMLRNKLVFGDKQLCEEFRDRGRVADPI